MNRSLQAISACLLVGGGALVGTAQDRRSLKNVFKDAFVIGTAVNNAILSGADTESRALVLRHFGGITADNVMKAGPINPRPGVFNFGPADAFVAFGEAHGMFIVGHTLVWHNQTPAWFFQDASGKPNSPAAQIERMRSHIEAVAGRYKGQVHAWDVVNEVIDNDGSYRPTSWVNAVGNGDELVKAAFRCASQYAPGAELYYNGTVLRTLRAGAAGFTEGNEPSESHHDAHLFRRGLGGPVGNDQSELHVSTKRPPAGSFFSLSVDVLSARVLVWVARAGRDAELTPEAHLYFFDRYRRLAEYHRARGHAGKARRFQARAAEHYQACGGDGPPYAAAMAMPRPTRLTRTNAVSRSRLDGPDDAA